MVFSRDGKSFKGFWWRDKAQNYPSTWDGTKISNAVGSCSHWSRSLGGELQKQLKANGRARIYGIHFALDSTVIKDASYPILTEIVDKGVATGRLTTVGYGSGKPVADNDNELGRAQNRRVELVHQ